jgi:uncharacterized membrane protein
MTLSTQNSSKKVVKDAPVWLSVTISILLILIGLSIGYYTYSQNQIAKILSEKGTKVKGTISFVDRTKTNENDKMNHYTISYSYNNTSYAYKTSLKYVFYIINEEVILLVNPDKPSQAMLLNEDDSEKGSFLWALFLISTGVLIIYYKRKSVGEK